MWTWNSLCLDFTLFPREVYVLTQGKSGEKSHLLFSPLSDQIQIVPVQGVLEENDGCLDASCRRGFKMATSFVFRDLKYLNMLWRYLMRVISLGN